MRLSKILIVDDEPEIVKVIEEFLIKTGFEVITALEGSKAIEIINSQSKINLMVLDMKMSEISGIGVLKEVKKINSQIPVIILTGSIDAQKHIGDLRSLGRNYDDILTKPVDLSLLLDKIKKKLPEEFR